MKDFWRALKYAALNKKLMAKAMTMVFLFAIIDLTLPQFYKAFFDLIDKTIRSGQIGTIDSKFWVLLAIFGLLMYAQDAINQGINYYIPKWWVETKKALTVKVFDHLQQLSLSYFEKTSTGKIKERVDRGISDLNNIMEAALMDILPQLFYVTVATILLFRVNVAFGLILLFSVPLFILIGLKYSKVLRKMQDSTRDAYEKLSGGITESILNVKTIKSYATESKHVGGIRAAVAKAMSHEMRYVRQRIVMNFFRFLIIDSTQILIIGLGVYWSLTGKITLGTFILAWQYVNRSFQPLWYLSRVIDNLQRDMRSVRRVFELLDTEPDVKDDPSARNLRIKKGAIEFKNVYFKYEDKKVVNGFSLKIDSGQVVAFVGKSGVGKTTLVKLLMRFYDPQKGQILIDEQDISKVKQKSLRGKIGYVLQDSSLFNNTVIKNIKYGETRATDADVRNAAKMANADVFIEKLPKKYNTVVGERGVKLSGGEQQRINIARAFLKNPPILILDEATSSLDSESEQLIQDSLWKLVSGKTTLIIAHRLSTIMRADLIVVMDKGKICEIGTHQDLVEQKGIYAKLFEIQSGGYLK